MPEKKEIAENLAPGSFQGVPIYFVDANTKGGRKATVRPILNSGLQRVSDTGPRPRTAQMTGYVAARYGAPDEEGVIISSGYKEQRKAILAVLENGLAGPLFHPFEGEMESMKCIEWSLDETVRGAGIGELTMVFERDDFGTSPTADVVAAADITSLLDSVEVTTVDWFEGTFGVPLEIPGAFEAALDTVTGAYEFVQSAAESVESFAADLTGLASDIAEATDEASRLLTSPLAVVTSIQNVVTSLQNVFPTLEARFDALVDGFSFGDDAGTAFSSTTYGGRQKQANREAIEQTVQTLFLANAYDAAAGLDLSTVDRIDEVSAILETGFQRLVGQGRISADMIDSLSDLRERFHAFLADRRVRAFDIDVADLQTPHTPRTLSYALYGTSDNDESIRAINDASYVSLLTTTARVLSR